MIYKLYTTTETKFFDDFMDLLNHLENNYRRNYQAVSSDPKIVNLYFSDNDEKFGSYTIVL